MTASDLTAFLGAQIDGDEAKIESWIVGELQRVAADGCDTSRDELLTDDPPGGYKSPFLRPLREVEAKRAIVRRCAGVANEMDVHPNGLVSPRALLARQTLMALAAVYNDRAGYREEWKP